MKKIVHMTSVHPVKDSRIFYKECISLKKAGYDVRLMAQADDRMVLEGVEIIPIPKTASRLQRMTKSLWKIYRTALKEKANLYHFHDPELIIVGLLLRLKGKKVIYDIHEDVPRDILMKEWIKPCFRRGVSILVSIFEKISAIFLNGLITVTPQINARFLHPSKAEVRNYPILNFQNKIRENKNNHFTLCYAGLITHTRGIREMIKAAVNTQSRLYLAGNFICNMLKTEVMNNQKINYFGYLSQEGISQLYEQSHVGLVLLHPGPTFNHSLPIKLFEYMAAGLPVIASDFPLWREIIEFHDCGFCVDPFNEKLVNNKILYLKNNPNIANEMGQRGKRAVENIYNWQQEFFKLENLYKKILG